MLEHDTTEINPIPDPADADLRWAAAHFADGPPLDLEHDLDDLDLDSLDSPSPWDRLDELERELAARRADARLERCIFTAEMVERLYSGMPVD